MKILITHVYSKENKGDAALLSVLLDDIRRVFHNPHITILTLDKAEPGEMFEGVPVLNGFMYYARDRYKNPLSRSFYGAFVALGTMCWAFFYRTTHKHFPLPKNLRDVVVLYQEADLIIPVGGGYIRSKAGFMSSVVLFFILQPIVFSYILGKTTVGYTQSIGPFGNKFQEAMAKFTVKRINGIIVREQISLRLLKKWGITKNVLLSVDSGFAFVSNATKDIREELKIPKKKILVGVTVRDWLKPKEQERYEKAFAKFCDAVIEKYDAAVIFIPQVTVAHHHDDDRTSARKVYDLMERKNDAHVLTDQYDHKTIKAIYGQLDYLVGTRFHSVIFALASYVPSIAIEYEHKTRGIMAELGLGEWMVDIQAVEADQLISLFEKLTTHRNEYIHQLERVLPLYIKQAEKSIEFVKEIYESPIKNHVAIMEEKMYNNPNE
jgi:colanic acid/amylovoran biosynthesis protein